MVCPLEWYLSRAQLNWDKFFLKFFLQVQGHLEHFLDRCGGAIAWLDGRTSYTGFKEGWALYAEYPLIGRDTDMYVDEPMQKYGMLKWLVRIHKPQQSRHIYCFCFIRTQSFWYGYVRYLSFSVAAIDCHCHTVIVKFLMSFLFKVWRSIRLIVDPGLNYFGMKRDKVLDYFKNYAWAESPFVLSEVKRNIVKSNVCLIIIHL